MHLGNQIACRPPASPTSDTISPDGLPPLPRIHEEEESDAMHTQDHPAPTAWIGIDVSKNTLDACFLPVLGKPRCRSFRNDPTGHADLLAWAGEGCPGGMVLGFCMESTSAYGEALATALAQAKQHVSIVNPARIKYAGLMRGQGNKTDKADAKLIAEYAQRDSLPAGYFFSCGRDGSTVG
jgi:hypothetical protein